MKKISFKKFMPLLALTFILSTGYTKNIFAVNPNITKIEEAQKLNSNLWHYRANSLNIANLTKINKTLNSNLENVQLISKVAHILKDLYQGYFIGYANRAEKLLIIKALENFTSKFPAMTQIKNFTDKARRYVLSLDDLIEKFTSYNKNDNEDLLELSPSELISFMNCMQNDIDFLPALSFTMQNKNQLKEEYQKFFVNKKIEELKDYGWIRRNKIQRFASMINQLNAKNNSTKKYRTAKAIIDLNLHKTSLQHAKLTYELLYNIIFS